MAARQAFSDPHDDSRLRLEAWCRRSFLRLSPLAGEDAARRVIDALVSECVGERIDQVAPEGFQNGQSPTYRDIRAFFRRFAPDVASYLPADTIAPSSMERLRLIQIALCARIVWENPETLGRCGKVLLSREWKEIEADLPELEAALAKVASTMDGEAAASACRRELEAILGKVLGRLNDPRMLLDLRRVARQSLTRRRRTRGPRSDH